MDARFAASALSAALIAAALLLSAPTQAAEPETMKPEAKQRLERGLELYEEQKYEQALAEFSAGYAIDPRPELLYASAQAERMSGDCASAIDFYDRFLATNPPPEREAAARANAARCRETLAAAEPAPKPPPPPEPPKRPKAAKPESKPTKRTAPPKQPEPVTGGNPPGGTPSDASPWYTDVLGGSLVIAGGIALGLGTFFYVSSIATEDEMRSNAEDPNAGTYSDHEADIGRAERQRRLGVIGFAAGGALVAGGVVRYLLLPSSKTGAAAWWAPGGGGATLIREF